MKRKETVPIPLDVFKNDNSEERRRSIEKLFLEIIKKSKDKLKV